MDLKLPLHCRRLGRLSCLLVLVGVPLITSCGLQVVEQVVGPALGNTVPPTIVILDPTASFSVSRGNVFLINWRDSDSDSNALISISLVDVATSEEILVLEGRPENDSQAADSFSVDTTLLPQGRFWIKAVINDLVNAPVEVFAMTDPPVIERVVVTIAPPGIGGLNAPPSVAVLQPQINVGVAQDDNLNVVVQPTRVPQTVPSAYDRDSETQLVILLDLDDNPNNDDPLGPIPGSIIVLERRTIALGDFTPINFDIPIDVSRVPIRTNGSPYFVRATIWDRVNPPVHSYAPGTLNVLRLADGVVDLGQIGRTYMGATFLGFNPLALTGSKMMTPGDFDGDGVDDFVIIAQKGNPRNLGNIGEAFLGYGISGVRYGGVANVNSFGTKNPGFSMSAPQPAAAGGRTNGITDVAWIRDISGDNLPELIIGMSHVEGYRTARDDDPGDDPPSEDETQNVAITVREGLVQVRVDGDLTFSGNYADGQDAWIDAASPGANHGGDTGLEWQAPAANSGKWALIKFGNLLNLLPDRGTDITSLNASLQITVGANGGSNANAHNLLVDFNENSLTYNNFDPNNPGTDPTAGIQYDPNVLGMAVGSTGTQFISVTEAIQAIVDGTSQFESTMAIIFVADATMPVNDVRFVSAEDNANGGQNRPTLRITYERLTDRSGLGCYPDAMPNNMATEMLSDDPVETGDFSVVGEQQGMVVVLYSENRDVSGLINPDRLADTVVDLQYVGKEFDSGFAGARWYQSGSFAENRAAGAIFQAAVYDWVDHLGLNQPPINALWGESVASMPDINNDQVDELIISAPNNEQDIIDLTNAYGPFATHLTSRPYTANVVVTFGQDFNMIRESEGDMGNSSFPQFPLSLGGCCSCNTNPFRQLFAPASFEILGEKAGDRLGGARSAGDFNLDGPPDVLMGAPLADPRGISNAGTCYVVYGRTPIGNYALADANNPTTRPPMLRIFGESPEDQLGRRQELGFDVNGDRLDDVILASAIYDGPNSNGVKVIDNGFVGIVFGGQQVDGDRTVAQIGTSELLGCRFFGANAGDLAGTDISTAGDFNQDGFGDLLITVPGATHLDPNGVERQGVVYLVFGGTHLSNRTFNLNQVGTPDLPGIVFYSPYQRGSADQAAPERVGYVGDINNDGFGDIMIGNIQADFVDPAEPGSRRPDAGEAYLIYGSNFGANRT